MDRRASGGSWRQPEKEQLASNYLISHRVTLFEDHIELDIKSGCLTIITKEFMKNEA